MQSNFGNSNSINKSMRAPFIEGMNLRGDLWTCVADVSMNVVIKRVLEKHENAYQKNNNLVCNLRISSQTAHMISGYGIL